MNAEDQAWLDALAGRGSEPEGRALGEALRARAAQRAAEPVQPPALAQLLAAAHAAGMNERAGCRACAWLRRQFRARPLAGLGGLAAAALLGFALLPQMPHSPRPAQESELLRGPAGTQLLRDTEPLARRERLAQALESHAVQVRRYERFGRAGLLASLSAAQQLQLADWLRSEGLALGADGSLQVEIEAAETTR